MKIERFNQINEIAPETIYEIWCFDKHGDAQEYYSDEYTNVNPFELEDIVEYFMEIEDTETLFIKKIVSTRLSNRVINKVKLELKGTKFNL
jgi:hypothetical protein